MADAYAPIIYVNRAVRVPGTIAYDNSPDQIFWFDCDRCGQSHNHTASEGHRAAHCDHYPFGYVLKERR